MKTARNPSAVLNVVLLTLFLFLFVFFLYTFLHELGHALAGRLFGQSLTGFEASFWNLSAHVELTGGELTQTQLVLRSAAGVLLPVLVWAIFIALVPRRGNYVLESLKLLSSMVVVNTLLPWIVLPVLYLSGRAPADDVTHFLAYSRMPPLLLSLTALLLYTGGWILFLSKIDGLGNELRMMGDPELLRLDPGTRATIGAMAGTMAVCAIVAFALNDSAARSGLDRFSPPPGFERVAHIDLSSRPYSSETLATLNLDRPAFLGVFIVVRNIDTTFFDLSVIGPDGAAYTVLHGEGYRASQDGGLWERNLPPGLYRLVLSADRSPGTASIYWNTPTP